MLCDVVNQLEIEISDPLHSDVHKQLNDPENWMDRIDGEIFNNFNDFDPTLLGCLKFLQNVREHWQDEPHPQLPPSESNYKKYFLQVFPELPLLVHRIIRYIERKSTPDLGEQFAREINRESSSFSYTCLEEPRSSASTFKGISNVVGFFIIEKINQQTLTRKQTTIYSSQKSVKKLNSQKGTFFLSSEEKKSLLYLLNDNDSYADIASYEKISLPSPMSDNDYDDIDKTTSTAVLRSDERVLEFVIML
ncbi:uncharacterized protein LOC124457328 [Xenia sp. Carnegie-2017]|uniref:uncharacterized protein LOC124457328 n=1 Tax=Xenia sp. Carnegie-2017 TaxID=2897299 RepID=UPI001F033721|nr:uncharacterized protein LOC124457328 [Xenia sp. Carnegie-2017]